MQTTQMQTIIDTLEINTKLVNIKDINIINTDNYSYIKQVRSDLITSKMTVALSINRRGGHYRMLTSLKEHKAEYNKAMEELGISGEKVNRVDIAIDSKINFKEEFKTLLYLFELLTYDDKKAERWYTTNLNTLEPNTIKSMGRSKDIVIYDKAEESNNRHPFNTRLEFRFKRLSIVEPDKQLDKLYKFIDTIDINIPLVNEATAERLIRLWEKEKSSLVSFSEFVRKYNSYFYTKDILKLVYKATGLKGSFNEWVKKFRKNNVLEFVPPTTVNKIKKDIKKSIRNYKNN